MKTKLSHKLFSALLALLVMVSTFSLAIEKHFCGDILVDVSLFSNVDSCCGGADDLDVSKTTKKSCCKNEVDVVEGQDNLVIKTSEDLDKITKQVLISYVFSFTKIFENTPKLIVPHKHYSPPIIVKDIHVLDETYLI